MKNFAYGTRTCAGCAFLYWEDWGRVRAGICGKTGRVIHLTERAINEELTIAPVWCRWNPKKRKGKPT